MNSSVVKFIWVLINVMCSALAVHSVLNIKIPEFMICPICVFLFLRVVLISSGFRLNKSMHLIMERDVKRLNFLFSFQ